MDKVLVLYPELFACQAKFNRKLARITERLSEFEVVCLHDDQGLIKGFIDDSSQCADMRIVDTYVDEGISHAVVFDDGEEFREEIEALGSMAIPLRLIEISITRVINIKREPQYEGIKSTGEYEYIGRGSYWGNPYSMYEDGEDRDEVIRKYRYDFDYEKFPNKNKAEVYKLAGKRLGCFCKPQACHGDVLAGFLNSWDDGK